MIAMELTKVLPQQCGGNIRGLLYLGKKGCEMKRFGAAGENSSGFTNRSLRRVELLSYSPRPGGYMV